MNWHLFRVGDPAHLIAGAIPGLPVVLTHCGGEYAASIGRPAHPKKDRKCGNCRRIALASQP